MSRELGVGSWESAVGSRELGVGSWESGVGSRELGVGIRELGIANPLSARLAEGGCELRIRFQRDSPKAVANFLWQMKPVPAR